MASPFFTWWPHMSGLLGARETITLSEDMSDLQVTPRRDVIDTYSLHGGRSREMLRPWLDVRLVLERFTDRDLFRKFSAMINHLERGGVVAFGLDSSKAWAATTATYTQQGDMRVYCGKVITEKYHAASASVEPAATDEFVIESGPPTGKREYHLIHSAVGSPTSAVVIDIDSSTSSPTTMFRDDYPIGSRVRFSDFYPTLILDAGAVGTGLLTHDHRISYTLDLPLVYVLPIDQPDVTEAEGDEPGDATPQSGVDISDKVTTATSTLGF